MGFGWELGAGGLELEFWWWDYWLVLLLALSMSSAEGKSVCYGMSWPCPWGFFKKQTEEWRLMFLFLFFPLRFLELEVETYTRPRTGV